VPDGSGTYRGICDPVVTPLGRGALATHQRGSASVAQKNTAEAIGGSTHSRQTLPGHVRQAVCAILVPRYVFRSTEVDCHLHKSKRDATLAGPVVSL
jgi:hypothetical protein